MQFINYDVINCKICLFQITSKVIFKCSYTAVRSCSTPQRHGLQPTRFFRLRGFSGKNTAVGRHLLLHGTFPTKGSKLRLLHRRRILHHSAKYLRAVTKRLQSTYCHVLCLVAQSCPTFCNPMNCSRPGSSVHGDSPSKNTGMGCHALPEGIFPTQRSNPGLLHCRWILYHLSHQASTRYWSG